MSVDSASDRALLEKKRNDELVVIANSLGLKPSPRSKKADLVEMIVSGATKTAASGAQNGASAAPSAPRTHSSAAAKSASTDTAEATAANSAAKRLIRSRREATPEPEQAAPAWDESVVRSVVSPLVRFEPTAVLPPIVVQVAAATEPRAREASSNGSGDRGTSTRNRSQGQRPARTEHGPQSSSTAESTPSNRGDNQRQESPRNEEVDRFGDRENSESANSRRRDKKRGRNNRPEAREGEPRIVSDQSSAELISFAGLLDLRDEGFGFIRSNGYLPSPRDIYVSVNMVRRFSLRRGDMLEGGARSAVGSEKYPALVRLDTVNGLDPEAAKGRARFEELTPLFPDSPLKLEVPLETNNVTARVIDLVSPIGKGQRGLIVSPPKAGKTTIMKEIAHCIEANNPEVYLMVLLVDERPEEVTDMRRTVKGEVVSSTFDRPSEEHVAVAELAIEKAKRMVEMGRDVVVILDGITRLTRAYNLALPPSGRIMSGGVDSGAIYPPKKFFGAARNVEEGGSLTILATALVETGSRMDEVIFEEFKGTGNMELRLDRRLAERRLYPAIDVNSSSTRHEELLFTREQLSLVWKLRRVLNALSAEGSSAPGLELLIDKIRQTKSNADFLSDIAKSPGI